MIRIKSKHDGFRRCGVAHTKSGQDFDDDFFTDDQIKQLKDDPMITVVRRDKACLVSTLEPEPEITKPEPEKTGKKTKSRGR